MPIGVFKRVAIKDSTNSRGNHVLWEIKNEPETRWVKFHVLAGIYQITYREVRVKSSLAIHENQLCMRPDGETICESNRANQQSRTEILLITHIMRHMPAPVLAGAEAEHYVFSRGKKICVVLQIFLNQIIMKSIEESIVICIFTAFKEADWYGHRKLLSSSKKVYTLFSCINEIFICFSYHKRHYSPCRVKIWLLWGGSICNIPKSYWRT